MVSSSQWLPATCTVTSLARKTVRVAVGLWTFSGRSVKAVKCRCHLYVGAKGSANAGVVCTVLTEKCRRETSTVEERSEKEQ